MTAEGEGFPITNVGKDGGGGWIPDNTCRNDREEMTHALDKNTEISTIRPFYVRQRTFKPDGRCPPTNMMVNGKFLWFLEMKNVLSVFLIRWYLWVVAGLLLGVGGCQVTLISAYDSEMDKAATALQKKMDAFLTKMETNVGLPQTDYTWNVAFYDDYVVELRSVHLRAQSDEKNTIMDQQLTVMLENLRQLRLAHEAGPLASPTIQATRDLFNKSWQVIIAQELAKRRGQ
jgi:hypothetical protein